MRVAALLNSGADIHTLGGEVSHQQTHMLIDVRVARLFANMYQFLRLCLAILE